MSGQRPGRLGSPGRPPAKPPAGKPLVAKPESLAVVDQDLNRRRLSVAEHEDPTTERIVVEHLLAEPGQAVDPLTEIGRLDGHHHAHLRRDLDHGSLCQKLRLNAARSGASTPLRWIRIFAPPESSNSIVHS